MKQSYLKNFRKNIVFSFFLILLGIGSVSAQTTITGSVSDENGEVIPGANIVIEGTTSGTSTDFDGNFTLSASSGDVLVISFLGYHTKKVTVGSQTVINVTLLPDAQNLDEVVVIGYGTIKKSDVVGSVSQVDSKSFEEQPMTRTEDALQGRAAGVTVAKSSGQPGAAIKVRIRGANSITGNNDPLVVVDGVIGGDLSLLNPNDIASMEVLKDASATAIYGSRGSNGVILVSTRKGRGKTSVSVEYFASVNTVPKQIGTLGGADFARVENLRRINVGGTAIFTDAEIAELEANGGTDYQDEFFRTAVTNNVQVSVSGQEGKLNYFLSGNYANEEGIVINTYNKRYAIRSNNSAEVIEDKLTIGLNLAAYRTQTHNDINGFGRYQGSDIVKALTWDPTTPIFDENGIYNNYSIKGLASLNYNPIANLNQSDYNFQRDRVDVNFTANWNIVKNLNYNLVVGATTINSASQNYNTEPPIPDANYGANAITNHQVSNIVTWHNTYNEKHDITATGVYEFSGHENKRNSYGATDLTLPGGFYLAELATGKNLANDYTQSSIQSGMFRGAYIYNNAFYFTGTVRIDASSVFRDGNRTGVFPSAAAAYSFNNMSFIADANVVTSLKLRAGWGQVGNSNIAPYSTYPSTSISGSYAFAGGATQPGSAPDGYGNPDLTWETTTQTNIGVDVGLLNNRIVASLDWYSKETTDLLLLVPVPVTNGGGNVLQNVGTVKNNGIDFTLTAGIIEKDNFNWDATFNFSYFNNEVTDLGIGADGNPIEEIQGQFESIDGQSRIWNVIQVGESLGQFQGSTFLGTYKTGDTDIPDGSVPGDAKYLRDADGNRVIGAIGNGTPTTQWGFNNTLTFGNWDMNIFFQGTHGFDVYNTVAGIIVGGSGNQRSYMSPDQLNQWTPENQTEIPAGGENDYGSTRYVENGGFVRLQNLSLGYSLRDVGIFDFKFYVSSQNLFLITDYTGYDPEHTSRPANNNGTVDVAPGINAGAYPNPRTFTFGIKAGF